MLGAWIILGLFFGSAAALSAYIITYREYARHKMERRRLIRHAASTAGLAFAFFFAGAIVIGTIALHGF